jgi:hypothetical protein
LPEWDKSGNYRVTNNNKLVDVERSIFGIPSETEDISWESLVRQMQLVDLIRESVRHKATPVEA